MSYQLHAIWNAGWRSADVRLWMLINITRSAAATVAE